MMMVAASETKNSVKFGYSNNSIMLNLINLKLWVFIDFDICLCEAKTDLSHFYRKVLFDCRIHHDRGLNQGFSFPLLYNLSDPLAK